MEDQSKIKGSLIHGEKRSDLDVFLKPLMEHQWWRNCWRIIHGGKFEALEDFSARMHHGRQLNMLECSLDSKVREMQPHGRAMHAGSTYQGWNSAPATLGLPCVWPMHCWFVRGSMGWILGWFRFKFWVVFRTIFLLKKGWLNLLFLVLKISRNFPSWTFSAI